MTSFLDFKPLWMIFCFAAAQAGAAQLAVVGAKLYPAPDAAAIADAVVLIEGDKIVAVGSRAQTPVPAGFEVIDASGAVLVAGLWNSHVHLTADGLLAPASLSDAALSQRLTTMFSQWGFTTVFDLASTLASATSIRERVRDGKVTGPRILTVGDPFFPPHGTAIYAKPIYEQFHLPLPEIKSTREAVERVDRQVKAGANGVKLFTGSIQAGDSPPVYMSARDVRAIASEAHRLGVPIMAHPTDAEGARVAVENGVDVLAHVDPLAGPWPAGYAQMLAKRHVALIPTLMLFEVYPSARTPVEVAVQQVAALSKAGGDVLFGTDAGFMEVYDPTREYMLMGRAMSWRAILASLTTTPARRFGSGERFGRVQVGYVADLTVLDGDPESDVAAFARVREVLRSGEPIYSKR